MELINLVQPSVGEEDRDTHAGSRLPHRSLRSGISARGDAVISWPTGRPLSRQTGLRQGSFDVETAITPILWEGDDIAAIEVKGSRHHVEICVKPMMQNVEIQRAKEICINDCITDEVKIKKTKELTFTTYFEHYKSSKHFSCCKHKETQ